MKAGRKPVLTFSELVKLRSIQAAFGKDSPEEAQFWELARRSAKLRRAIKRGKNVAPTPRKYKTYAEAHNASNRAYYQRHKEHIRTYYNEWYERQKAK